MIMKALKRLPCLALLALGAAMLTTTPAGAGPFDRAISSERAVRAMPIEQRPNRFGHIYGNNVRRLYHGRIFVNQGRSSRPVTRFFYVP